MAFQRMYLDSNIFIRAFESSPNDDIAQDIIGMLGLLRLGHPPRFVTSQITLAEVLVKPIRTGDSLTHDQYVRTLARSTPWLQVRTVSQSILMSAANLRAKSKLKLPDAIHAASAIANGCSHILTSDTDFLNLHVKSPDWPMTVHPTRGSLDDIIAWLRA